MSAAFLVSACRTPIGRFQGGLSGFAATDLGAIALRGAVAQADVPAEAIEEAIMGMVLPAGAGQAPARQAALKAGLSPQVAALTVNKVCGSGLKAIMLASQAIRCGDADLIVAGGMECMSQAAWVLPRNAPAVGDRTLQDSMMHDGLTCAMSGKGMGIIADDLARREEISRADQDAFSLESHRRAVAARESGLFAEEIVPATVADKAGPRELALDEGPRSDTTLERLAKLKPAFWPDGTVTAGNSSMLSDGAAAAVVASQQAIERHALKPLARILASATSGGAPEDLFTAPIAAIQSAVAKAGLTLADVSLFEINEAFASQLLACTRSLQLPMEKVNVQGGAIALGHPIGASGARVLTTLVHALRRRGERYGVAALCLGGGNAVAMAVENIANE
jgi:acetyl-CoA C-acetyltransferase